MQVIDAHAHIFNRINGIKQGDKTSPAPHGRFLWRGEEHIFLPPHFRETAFTADSLIKMMDFSGVSKAVLLQNPVIGSINEEIREAVRKYPSRLAGTLQVDPMSETACGEIEMFMAPGIKTLKLEISEAWGWAGNHPGFSLRSKPVLKIWELLARLGMNVIIDTGDIDNAGYQVENIAWLSGRFPEVKILIEHLAFFRERFRENPPALARRDEMLDLARQFKNVYLGFSSTAAFINDDYPCPQALQLLKEAVELVGSKKILWGSDIPSTLKKYTYRQLVDVVAVHAAFLSSEEKENILWLNADLLFFS